MTHPLTPRSVIQFVKHGAESCRVRCSLSLIFVSAIHQRVHRSPPAHAFLGGPAGQETRHDFFARPAWVQGRTFHYGNSCLVSIEARNSLFVGSNTSLSKGFL